uniref:Branched-chain-amino-acid aminotransferase n=1 Tax=Daphnia similis TaxID=35528 RepID=A0A4Y7N3C2_9CRUS|nr:EOG090X051P [Daphnia similis]SVE87972.1 EOG090X051P [Daphnia similis]
MAYSSVSDELVEEFNPKKEEKEGSILEVGDQAVWSLSSCKAGFGIDQLRDDSTDTYWQSDGQLPHLVNIQFRKKTTIQNIWIFADYKADESYTPSRISIRAGTGFSDLQEVEVVELNEPNGWIAIPLKDAQDKYIRTFMLQLAILSNHQSGRDTHLRNFSHLEEKICTPDQLRPKPDNSALVFGKYFTDHMLEVSWDSKRGWAKPIISPLHNLQLHPGAKVLHYAIELFEGMKAYRGEDGCLRLFRPDRNMARMLSTAKRSSLPTFDAEEMIKCIKRLIQIDKEWVPYSTTSSLYIRPTFIATDPSLGVASPNEALLYVLLCPVGPYFTSGFKPISLMADPQYVRSWPGGCGAMKMGANYAPTIYIQKQSELLGHQQVLWLYGADHQLTEVGTMNIFLFMLNKNGERELVTPPLDGLILPGVTRLSLLELAREWKEFRIVERTITMAEVIQAHEEKRLLEIFGAGTACVVCPVSSISYQGREYNIPRSEPSLSQRFLKTMSDIHYGRVQHPWAVDI